MNTMTVAWLFTGIFVWVVMTGAMVVFCWMEDISEADYLIIENEQRKRNQDVLETLKD